MSRTAGTKPPGALLVRTGDGRVQAIVGGDVSVRPAAQALGAT